MIVPKSVAVVLALYAGLAIILQNGVNTNLNLKGIPSPFATAGVSYTVGFIAISIISIIDRPPKFCCKDASNESRISIATAPWYAYCGGPLGAVYVTAAILLASKLGFATFQLAVTFGQLSSSMICDAMGFLYLQKTPTTPWRVLCLLLLAMGTALSSYSSSNIEDSTNKTLWWPLYFAGAMAAGCVFPVQSCVNFVMTQHIGTPFRAVVVNFAMGAMSVWTLTSFSYLLSHASSTENFFFYTTPPQIPLWMWVGGGILGATFITSAVIGLPSLGAVAFTGIFISTQLVVASIFDATGAFGFHVVPVTSTRVCGIVLAVLAAAAFQQAPPTSMPWLDQWPPESFSTTQEQKPLVAKEEEEKSEESKRMDSLRDSHFV